MRFVMTRPRTPEEFAAAEKLEELGYIRLNSDGTITVTAKGQELEQELTDEVLAVIRTQESAPESGRALKAAKETT